MTVRRLRVEMPAAEFKEWAAFYNAEAKEAERQARLAKMRSRRRSH